MCTRDIHLFITVFVVCFKTFFKRKGYRNLLYC